MTVAVVEKLPVSSQEDAAPSDLVRASDAFRPSSVLVPFRFLSDFFKERAQWKMVKKVEDGERTTPTLQGVGKAVMLIARVRSVPLPVCPRAGTGKSTFSLES